MADTGYYKSTLEVMRNAEKALKSIALCTTYAGVKCAPNDEDFILVKEALADIYEYFHVRDIKF
jgi:hypothetical protein